MWEVRLVVPLAVAPWVLVALVTGGPSVAVHMLVTLAVLGGLGALALRYGMTEHGEALYLLAIPVGFVFAASLLALGLRIGLSVRITGWALVALGLMGLLMVRGEGRGLGRQHLRYGVLYIVLSAMVCGLYFAPGAWQDGVTTADGSFQWMYIDTQYQMANAAVAKTDQAPPAMPGMSTAPFIYHFAPYSVAGAISAMTGLTIADATVRVVRGIGLLALLLASLGLGRILARRIGDADLGGIASVVGLFLYGSLSALFGSTNNTTATAELPAVLFPMPGLAGVVHDGGWFSHLVLGHSELWGGIGLLVTLALVTHRLTSITRPRTSVDLSIVVPALVLPINVIAGIGATGVVASVYAIMAIRHRRALLVSAGSLVVAGLVAWIMGYIGSPSASGVAIDAGYSAKALTLWRWLFVGLGVRVVAGAWFRRLRIDPAAWILIALVAGYFPIWFFLKDSFDGHNLYALKFLQGVLSVYAFAWLGGLLGRTEQSWFSTVARELLRWSWRLGVVLLTVDLVAASLTTIRGQVTPRPLVFATIGALAVTLCSGVLLVWRERSPTGWRLASVAVFLVISLGFAAWLPSWMGYGLNRLRLHVTMSSDEVAALRWVRDTSRPDALIATNHHSIDAFRARRDRSYGYRMMAERPILLEGWEYGEMLTPQFPAVRRDNQVLFQTEDTDKARAIVQKYNIKYIVTAPGTDLQVTPEASWLQLAAHYGSVKVYQVQTAPLAGSTVELP